MVRLLTIVATLGAALGFYFFVPLDNLFRGFQQIVVALSIMVAAIFVRLNRGMPTLEWKALDRQQRSKLTAAIVDVAAEFGWIIGINAAVLTCVSAITIVGVETISTEWPDYTKRLLSAALGGGLVLTFARMAYVVWRDLDIIRLQKQLIDSSAARDELEAEGKKADAVIGNIRNAGLQKPPPPSVKGWQDE